MFEQFRPHALTLLPDYDFTVVGGAGEDVAEFGVCPRDLPDGPFVAVGRVSLCFGALEVGRSVTRVGSRVDGGCRGRFRRF